MMLSKLLRQATTARQLIQLARVRNQRFMSTGPPLGAHGGHDPNPDLWKRIFLYVCCPAIVLSMINTYLEEVEHWNHYTRPEFVPMEYLRIRNKKFPWGDGNHTLFHNPLVNPLPEGWEPLPPELAAKYDRKPDQDHGSHH